MRKFVHSWSSHDGARDWPGSRLCARFLYNTILYLLTSLFIGITFSVGKFFPQAGEGNQQGGQPLSSFLLSHCVMLINRLTHCQLWFASIGKYSPF